MQAQDFKWFKENYNAIFDKYGDSVVVVKNKNIIGVYKEYNKAVEETVKNEPLGSFIVQKCNGDESAYTNYIATVCLA